MKCIVTAGPTYESLDEVRRLTNSSTGRLGSELANFLAGHGHEVILLLGEQATYHTDLKLANVERFTNTTDLHGRLKGLATGKMDAVFHAAAVSDFTFGKICSRDAGGELMEIKSRKISTRAGALFAELVPTPKIIAELRGWYPQAKLTGWKFELEDDREAAKALGRQQMIDCRTDACVVNGRAYGDGFGLMMKDGNCVHLKDGRELYQALLGMIG